MKNNKLLCLGILFTTIYSSHSMAQDHVSKYTYDARGRLVKVTDGSENQVNYTLDDAGNRLNVSGSSTPVTPDPVAPVPVIPAPVTLPIITTFNSPSSVNRAGAWITISWTSTNTSHCALAEFGDYSSYPSLSTSGTQSIRIYEDTAITLTCYKGSNSDSKAQLIRADLGDGRAVF